MMCSFDLYKVCMSQMIKDTYNFSMYISIRASERENDNGFVTELIMKNVN